MVSTLSTFSLVLAITGALGQQCTPSSAGNTVVDDMNTLLTEIGVLQIRVNNFEIARNYNNGAAIYYQQQAVANELASAVQAINVGGLNDCDFTTLIGLIGGDVTTTLVPILQSFVSDYTALSDVGAGSLTRLGTQMLTDNFQDLISAVYSSVPGCGYASQAIEAASSITAALASTQSFYGMSGTPPVEPAACPTSSPTSSPTSTPTSPPTCKKQVKRAN
ncbi:hypothetical protein TRVA0_048S00210 [Trichomonascus vanleenenianus]|uniref:uncharacterized protein n=1 Tax=Trichomonascus vanleenenianus TaxID=2268995 RepID=UPI003EC9F63A